MELPGFGSILPKFYILKAQSDFVGLVGLEDYVQFSAHVTITVNNGSTWPGGFGPPVVNSSTASRQTDADADGTMDVNELLAWQDTDASGTLEPSELTTVGTAATAS